MCWFSPAENAIQSIFVIWAIWLHGEANQRGTRNREIVVDYWGDTGVHTLTMNNSTPEVKQAWEKGGVGKKYQEAATHNKIIAYSSITVITAYNMNIPLQQMTWITGTQFKLSPLKLLFPGSQFCGAAEKHGGAVGKQGPHQGQSAQRPWLHCKAKLARSSRSAGWSNHCQEPSGHGSCVLRVSLLNNATTQLK